MSKPFSDDTILARWLSGELTEAELSELESREDFADLKKIVETTEHWQTPHWQKGDVWANLAKETGIESTPKVAKIRRIGWLRYASAAAVLLLLSAVLFLQFSIQNYTTNIGQKRSIDLPDGSRVTLNAGSELQHSSLDFLFLRNRKLTLKGEGFFEVEKGTDFIVESENGSVQVLGTKFNVFSRNNQLNVTCYAGKVKVALEENKSQIIEGGTKLISQNKSFSSPIFFAANQNAMPSWINGESLFSDAPFIEVFEELQRQFDISIESPEELNQQRYNGGFFHDNLQEALIGVLGVIDGYDFRMEGRKVIVFAK